MQESAGLSRPLPSFMHAPLPRRGHAEYHARCNADQQVIIADPDPMLAFAGTMQAVAMIVTQMRAALPILKAMSLAPLVALRSMMFGERRGFVDIGLDRLGVVMARTLAGTVMSALCLRHRRCQN